MLEMLIDNNIEESSTIGTAYTVPVLCLKTFSPQEDCHHYSIKKESSKFTYHQ